MKHSLLRQHFNKLLIAFIVFVQTVVYAQPAIQWDKTFGGPSTEDLNSITPTADGGYLLSGNSGSQTGGDVSDGLEYGPGLWLVKINAAGVKQWDKTLGDEGNPEQELYTTLETNDGGYILATYFVTAVRIIKLDRNREVQWQTSLRAPEGEGSFFGALEKTADGGYIVGISTAGDSNAIKSENHIGDQYAATDYWVIKLSSDGKIQWENTIGGTDYDNISSIKQTLDGGYILAGWSSSGASFDKSEPSKGGSDYWIVKLDANGIVKWNKTIGGSQADYSPIIHEANGGGYIVAGNSNSPVSGNKTSAAAGFWIVKLSISGQFEWDRVLTGSDDLRSFIKTSDGGYLLGGRAYGAALGDRSTDSQGNSDMWIIKITANGTKMWDKTIGGKSFDNLSSILQASDGGYLLGATSDIASDNTGDKTAISKGLWDYWIVKLAPEPASTIRINAGGPEFTTATKKTFIADKYYAGIDRTSSIASGDILNTTNDVLYRSGRSSPSFSYNIPIRNGKVDVTLHFAETYYGAPGKKGGAGSRQFNVNIEGSRKLTNFDIFTAAGGALRAYQRTFPVTVTDGVLNIDFLSGAADLPRVSAIEVVPVTNFTLQPLADAYVQDGTYNKANFGATDFLDVKKSSSNLSANRSAYLKFQLPVTSGITSAKLRIYGHNHENSNNISVHAYGVNYDGWIETTINKVNSPAASTASLGYVSVNNVYKYYEIDVTAYVKSQQQPGDQVVSLLLQDPNNRNTRLVFNSKENGANPPQLIVQTAPLTVSNTREGVEDIIAEKEAVEVNIFPNPASEILSIEMPDWHKVKSVELLNSFSDVVYHSGEKPVQSVNVKEFPVGIYFLRIGLVDGSSSVRKVLVGR